MLPFTLEQALALCEGADLTIDRVLDGFTEQPYGGGEIFTVVARRR